MLKKFFSNSVFGPLAVVFLVFWPAWRSGVSVAHDFPFAYPSYFQLQDVIPPQTWRTVGSDGLGYFSADTQWSWPLDLFTQVLGKTGLPFSWLTRLVFIIPFIFLSVTGISRLLARFRLNGWGIRVGSLFYSLNTYSILLIDGGQMSLALAYSLIPWCFFLLLRNLDSPSLRSRLLFAGSLLAVSITDLRFVYLLGLAFALRIVFDLGRAAEFIRLATVSAVVLLGFHFYWIWPLLLSHQSGLPAGYADFSQLGFLNFTSLGHALLFLQPHWFKNIFGQVTPLIWEFIGLPFLAFLAPAITRKKEVAFWVVLAIISVFLVKGFQPPLPQIYAWAFDRLPGFFLFRDSSKFFTLQALTFSVLMAFVVSHLAPRVRWLGPAALIYLLFLIRPVYLLRMTGFFSRPPLVDEYQDLAAKLASDSDFSRVFWLPSKPSLGLADTHHPALEAAALLGKRPFAIGTVGTYETFNYIRESPYMDDLFDISGIKYIINPPPDPRRDSVQPIDLEYRQTFLSQLSALPWLDPVSTSSAVPWLVTRRHQNRFFIASNLWFVLGEDDPVYRSTDLADTALVFTDEYPGLVVRALSLPQTQVVMNGKTLTDLAAGTFSVSYHLFPAQKLSSSPDSSGWWKRDTADFLSWRHFLQQKYSLDNLDFDYQGGWAVSEGDNSLRLTDSRIQPGMILLARVMHSPNGGGISFSQSGREIGAVETFLPRSATRTIKLSGFGNVPDQLATYSKSQFSWHVIGSLQTGSLQIDTQGEINVINSLLIVSQSQWSAALNQADKLKNRNIPQFDIPKPIVNYARFSPSKYRVEVSGLKRPAFLVFSQNYNPGWELSGRPSLPAYSFLNVFPVDQDGQYEIMFAPQKPVLFSLAVSAVFLVSLGFVWVLCARRQ